MLMKPILYFSDLVVFAIRLFEKII